MYKADEGVLTSSSLTETEVRERPLPAARAREKSQREEPERRAREIMTVDLTEKAGSVFAGELKAEILQQSEPGQGSCTRSTSKTVES